jgi:hypothetical protein
LRGSKRRTNARGDEFENLNIAFAIGVAVNGRTEEEEDSL